MQMLIIYFFDAIFRTYTRKERCDINCSEILRSCRSKAKINLVKVRIASLFGEEKVRGKKKKRKPVFKWKLGQRKKKIVR